ncbi:MAG: hypothetical protein WDN08_07640 [Rhizomicrobium sp.]
MSRQLFGRRKPAFHRIAQSAFDPDLFFFGGIVDAIIRELDDLEFGKPSREPREILSGKLCNGSFDLFNGHDLNLP